MKYRLAILLLMAAGMAMAQTRLSIEPKDAILEIDGKEYHTDEGKVTVYLPDGLHNVTVMMQGYDTYEKAVSFGKENREIEIKLTEKLGYLTVKGNAETEGSSVYLDNKMVGTVPISDMKMVCGPHSVVVVKKGCNPYSERVFIASGKTTEVIPILDTKRCHVRMVAAEGVEIWFEGDKQGVGEWNGNLDEGTYTFVTKKESHQNGISQIVLTGADSIQEIQLPLPQPIYGSLLVDVTPIGSEIYIDGKKEGVTPLFKQLLLIGNHSVEVRSAGLLPKRDSITVTENTTSEVKGELMEGGEVRLKCEKTDAIWQIDGKNAGKGSEISAILPFGTHTVNIETIDFEPYEGVFVTSASTGEVPFKLKQKQPEYFDLDITVDTIRFVKVKGNGTTLEDFYISETEVTQKVWQSVMERTIFEQKNSAGKSGSYGEGDNFPVYFVSWSECMVFLRKLSKQCGLNLVLPTEEQWEYVATGGIYSEQEQEMDYLFWNQDNSGGKSHAVETSGKNALGLYGLRGNVAEMCMDEYNQEMYQYHVCKGGSWNNTAAECNTVVRRSVAMTERYKDVGFRIVIKH